MVSDGMQLWSGRAELRAAAGCGHSMAAGALRPRPSTGLGSGLWELPSPLCGVPHTPEHGLFLIEGC